MANAPACRKNNHRRLIRAHRLTIIDAKREMTSLKSSIAPPSSTLHISGSPVFRIREQLGVQRRSYNVIYGSGVNYGNADLPFTSHQTDNRPVSCCYDRRRGVRSLSRLFACCTEGERQTGLDPYHTLPLIYEQESQVWLGDLSECGIFWRALATALQVRLTFPSRQKVEIFLLLFIFFKNKKNLHLLHLCLHFHLHIKEIPSGPALHIYI